MIIIKGNLEKLKNSEFYDKDCWDYPKEEVDMLKEDENYSNGVYLMAENRVYETLCDIHDFGKLLEKVNGEILHITSKEQNEILVDVVDLFMEENDKKALEKLYELTNDKLVKLLIDWNAEYEEFIEEPGTYAGDMYEDVMSYIWDKYNLNEIEKTIDKDNSLKEKVIKITEENPDNIYSRKELINILNSEKAIKVCGKSNYTPTDFLKIDDKVFFRNKHIGTEKIWYEHPNTVEKLLNHLENMQNEGFVIQIISDKEYFKPFKDPEENFYVTNNPDDFDYMEYKGYRTCYIEDTNTIVIHKIIPNEEESYTDYDETIINRNYTVDNLKRIIDTEYIKENTNDEENEEYQI